MKAKDEARLGALRMVKTALKKQEVNSMKPLDEATEMQILKMLVKQRKESAEMFRKGSREDLAVKEEAELTLIETFMPAVASDAEVEEAVTRAITETNATSSKQMGLVIKSAQSNLAGKRVDGKVLSDLVKARLA